MMILIFLQLAWLLRRRSVSELFFMSVMFPTIFALGIHGLAKSKPVRPSSPWPSWAEPSRRKLMGWVSDHFGHVENYYGRIVQETATGHLNTNLMAPGFIVPLFCFLIVALYGLTWPKLSQSDSAQVSLNRGH